MDCEIGPKGWICVQFDQNSIAKNTKAIFINHPTSHFLFRKEETNLSDLHQIQENSILTWIWESWWLRFWNSQFLWKRHFGLGPVSLWLPPLKELESHTVWHSEMQKPSQCDDASAGNSQDLVTRSSESDGRSVVTDSLDSRYFRLPWLPRLPRLP